MLARNVNLLIFGECTELKQVISIGKSVQVQVRTNLPGFILGFFFCSTQY